MSLIGDGHGSVIKLHEVIDCDAEDKLILVIDYAQFGEIMSWDEDSYIFETCLEQKKFFNETDI
jgi:SNF1-activating kinase 1